MLMLGLSETIDQLATAGSVHWYGHVFSTIDSHVLRKAFEFESQRKKCRMKRTWKKQVGEEGVKAGMRMEDAPC